jgi:hypothetical protein
MSQQYVHGNANDKYKKKLFVDTGMEYVEVNCKVVEPYSPPAPQPKVKELQIINAPSHIHNLGIASYKCTLTLLFPDKQSYNDYLMHCGWTHKYYDEKGHIYLGSVDGLRPKPVEANKRYVVEITLVLIKKDAYDASNRFQYQDINGHWGQVDIEEMSNDGLVAVIAKNGDPVLYFRPNDYVTRAEYITFLNRTRRFIERIVRE